MKFWNLHYYFLFVQLHRSGPGVRFLDMDVCIIKTSRIRRHSIHHTTETTSDIPPLVSSRDSAPIYLVFILGVHSFSTMVHRYELLCPFLDVFILCTQINGLLNSKVICYDHYTMSVGSDDNWMWDQYLGTAGDPARFTGMPHFTYKYQTVPYHVLQLLCAVC